MVMMFLSGPFTCVVRHARRGAQELCGALAIDAGVDLGNVGVLAASVRRPDPFAGRVDRLEVVAARDRELALEVLAPRLGDLVGLVGGHFVVGEEALEVALAHGRALADALVHARLRERGLVALVVPVAPVAVEVDHDVAPERAAELHGQLDHLRDGLGILAVDVEDRDLQHLGDVGRVGGAAPLLGAGREAELVVDDDVERAPDLVACERRHVSCTTPSPMNAASPWMRIGSTCSRRVSSRRSCLARTRPSTTGFTYSRCDGLKVSDMWIVWPELVVQSFE